MEEKIIFIGGGGEALVPLPPRSAARAPAVLAATRSVARRSPAYPVMRLASVIHVRNNIYVFVKKNLPRSVDDAHATTATATREAHVTRPTAYTASPNVQYANTYTTTFPFKIFLIHNLFLKRILIHNLDRSQRERRTRQTEQAA